MGSELNKEEIRSIRKNHITSLVIGLILLILGVVGETLFSYQPTYQVLFLFLIVMGCVFSSRAFIKLVAFNKYINQQNNPNSEVLDD